MFSLALALTANAATNQRSFVSAGTGSDANPCTRPAPCRNFAAAIANTLSGGEVIVLDSGGYGAFAVAIPMSFISPSGVYAGMSVFSGDGITVATTSGSVTLGGLTINGLGGNDGVSVTTGTPHLYIDSCHISGVNTGVNFDLNTTHGRLYVTDSTFRNGAAGILVEAGLSNTAVAMIERSQFHENIQGLISSGTAKVTCRECVAASSAIRGFWAAGAGAQLNLESCVAMNNDTALWANSGGIIRISNSAIVNNGTGVTTIGGTVYTRSNNTFGGNTTDGDPPTPLSGW